MYEIPSFEEVLQQFAGRVVMNIHIKSLSSSIEAMLNDSRMCERLRQMGKIYTESAPPPMPLSEPVEEVLQELEELTCEPYDENVFAEVLRLIDQYQCSRVQFCKLFLTMAMIEKAHANGILCNLFWSDDPEEANSFFNMGIDVILTNHYLKIARA